MVPKVPKNSKLIAWTFFLNPKYSYKITFNNHEIIIGKEAIKWERISEYLLMEKGKTEIICGKRKWTTFNFNSCVVYGRQKNKTELT